MAEILPLRPWRYNDSLKDNIDDLTSPLFDVISEKQREVLYKNPLNSIHISVPLAENPAEHARVALHQWKVNKVIVQDPLPGIYVYYQYFTVPGSTQEICRKGFIANIKAYDWGDKEILRHENTIPSSVNDRIDLLEQTKLNVSPTHGLYADPEFQLEGFMDESIKHPLYDTEDYQGVKDVLSVIHDAKIIRKFMEVIASKKIILADGHHRYEGSLSYRKKCTEANLHHTGNEGYNFHMMYLTNIEGQEYRILPTHRIVSNLPDFEKNNFLSKIEAYFTIKPVENAHDIGEIILGKKWAFGLILKDETYKLKLKPEAFAQMHWKFPTLVKEMDLTVMHYFIFEKILGIPGKKQRASPCLEFTRDFIECLHEVEHDKAQLALITQNISIEDVKKICFSGYMMPQKSTYFYPKVICGFLFSSIKEDEFHSPPYPCF
ncbi:MAG: DUF1015 domain-containing protein [Bacteroidota bacterium]|nr:DUF1015 domain-containing protein [Bacteroidota bacterium]